VSHVEHDITDDYFNTIFSVLLISDTPYGVTDEEWDKAWTRADLLLILKQFVASNKAQEWAVFFWHTPQQTAMFLEVLTEMGYTEATHLCWHKTDHTGQNAVAMHTSSWEMGTLAFLGGRQKNSINLSRDPRYRHNHIEHATVSKKFKDVNGVVANPCQKPEGVAQWIIGSVCMPGSTVLVVGPGAGGGEVVGSVLSGCHVVAVEKNQYQFQNLQANLLQVKEKMIKEQLAKQEAAADEKDEVLESQAFSAGLQYSQSMGRPNKPVQAPICAHCGLPLDGEEFECSVPECSDEKPKFHEACTVIREGVRICLDCNRNATDDASQADTQEID
jgi:hypothetical protein